LQINFILQILFTFKLILVLFVDQTIFVINNQTNNNKINKNHQMENCSGCEVIIYLYLSKEEIEGTYYINGKKSNQYFHLTIR
jgi:hypothetical protein